MMKLGLIGYLCTGAAFAVLDAGWLSLVGPHLYRPALDPLLADQVRIAPAIVFYALYIAGLTWFCVLPTLAEGWTGALIAGVLLGLVAYGAYDLTCHATMKVWSLNVTLADMAWGAFASGVASAIGSLGVRLIVSRTGS